MWDERNKRNGGKKTFKRNDGEQEKIKQKKNASEKMGKMKKKER